MRDWPARASAVYLKIGGRACLARGAGGEGAAPATKKWAPGFFSRAREPFGARVERGARVADDEELAAGLFCKVAEAFRRAARNEPSVGRLEERNVNHVEGDARRARFADDSIGAQSARVVEAVAKEDDDAA